MKEYLIKSGFLDRQRKLVLAENHMAWENGDLKGKEFLRISKSDYADFKHGMDWIVWYKFTVGREYSITFNDTKNQELKIRFHSYFGLNNENHQKYFDIINDVWSLYRLCMLRIGLSFRIFSLSLIKINRMIQAFKI